MSDCKKVHPPQAHKGLQLMMRLYKQTHDSPEWETLRFAVEELKRLYTLEAFAQTVYCRGDVNDFDTFYTECDCDRDGVDRKPEDGE
jgi:hypothetical protein